MAEKTRCKLSSFLLVHLLIVCARVTAIYAQGVGLGASKGKEIGKFSEGYSGYVQQAQEAVSTTAGVLETLSLSHKSRLIFSTLPIVHVRLANAMEAEGSLILLFIFWFASPLLPLLCCYGFQLFGLINIIFGHFLQEYLKLRETRHCNIKALSIGKPGRTIKVKYLGKEGGKSSQTQY